MQRLIEGVHKFRREEFGRYRELAILGQGGMARVVLAALDGPHGVQKLLVIKAQIQFNQQRTTLQDAQLQMENDRLTLAVLLFPNFTENFSLIDDLDEYVDHHRYPHFQHYPDLYVHSALHRYADIHRHPDIH